MTSTDDRLTDIKDMLLGIEITLLGITASVTAVLFESFIAFLIAGILVLVGLGAAVSGYEGRPG